MVLRKREALSSSSAFDSIMSNQHGDCHHVQLVGDHSGNRPCLRCFPCSYNRVTAKLANFLPFIVLMMIALGWMFAYHQHIVALTTDSAIPPSPNLKRILFYTKYWGQEGFQFGTQGQEPFIRYQCPIDTCHVTHDRSSSRLGDFDAVIFSAISSDWEDVDSIPQHLATIDSTWRKSHQRFVMVAMESPINYAMNWTAFNGFFNWTMTYRNDSDIPRPYGWFQAKAAVTRRNQNGSLADIPSTITTNQLTWIQYDADHFYQTTLPEKDDSFIALAHRPKKIAWIVSNCHHSSSMRNEYAQELSKHIPVDIFGGSPGRMKRCNSKRTIPCDTSYSITNQNNDANNMVGGGTDNCTRAVEQDYKYYLSFENSLCYDYVTEKFFGRMQQNVLVIALGSANYTAIAPPHSHLNVFDFENPKVLASYLLNHLDAHPEEYLSYFWWKDHYEAIAPWKVSTLRHSDDNTNNFGQAMCSLCAKLHDSSEQEKVYSHLQDWWYGKAKCGKALMDLQTRVMSGKMSNAFSSIFTK